MALHFIRFQLIVRALLPLTLVSMAGVLMAQDDDSSGVIFSSTLRTVKWAPLAMVDLVPAAQFAYEYPVGGNRTLQHELGFISHTVSPMHLAVGYSEVTGVRARSELRFYNDQQKGYGDFYIAPEVSYTYYRREARESFQRFDGAFFQELDYEGTRQEAAAHFKLGAVYPSPYSPFSWDIFMGFGLKYRHLSSNMPDDARPDGPTNLPAIDSWFFPENGGSLRFSVIAGFRVGYRLP